MAPRIAESYVRIWRAVSRIPKGRVSTYGAIAKLSGYPLQARLVGYALHALPDGTDVPWHRVINARGRISLRPGAGRQQRLLEREGIVVMDGAIDLGQYLWKGARRRTVKRTK